MKSKLNFLIIGLVLLLCACGAQEQPQQTAAPEPTEPPFIKERINILDKDGELIAYHVYTYDHQGLRLKAEAYDTADTELAAVDIIYDAYGNKQQSYRHDSSGMLYRTVHQYDSDGNIIRSEYYDAQDKLEYFEEITYNSENRATRRICLNAEAVPTQSSRYEYMDGAQIEYFLGNEAELLYYTVSTYGEHGVAVCEYFEADGTMFQQYLYQYDETGEMRAYSLYDGSGNMLERHKYEREEY